MTKLIDAILNKGKNEHGFKNRNKKILKIFSLLNNPNIDIREVDQYGNTALMIAASRGYLDIVKLIVSCTVSNINENNNQNHNALFIAAHNSYSEVVRFLIEKGANTSCLNGKSLNDHRVEKYKILKNSADIADNLYYGDIEKVLLLQNNDFDDNCIFSRIHNRSIILDPMTECKIYPKPIVDSAKNSELNSIIRNTLIDLISNGKQNQIQKLRDSLYISEIDKMHLELKVKKLEKTVKLICNKFELKNQHKEDRKDHFKNLVADSRSNNVKDIRSAEISIK